MKQTSLRSGAFYITISTVIFMASGYLTSIWLGRHLGPASYGIYGVIISLMTFINLTQTSGLPQSVSKYIAEDEGKANNILRSALILQLMSTVTASSLFFILAYPIALLLNDPNLVPYIRTASLIFPLYGIYSIYLNYYNGLHFFKAQALMSIIYSVAKLIAIIGLVHTFNVYGAILGFIVAPLFALLFFFRLPIKKTKNYPFKKLLLFSVPLIVLSIFATLLQSIDLFFVKSIMKSNTSTGFYVACQNIAIIPFYGITALASVLFPSISRGISQKLTQQVNLLISKSLRFTVLFITPCVVLISATSAQLIKFLYSNSYQEGASALSILVFGLGFFTFFTIFSTIISSSGYPMKSALLAGIGVFISIVFCLVLIPHYGIVGAAISTTIATFSIMIFSGIIVINMYKVTLKLNSITKVIFSSLLIYIVTKSLVVPDLYFPFVYVLGFSLYIFLLIVLKELSFRNFEFLIRHFPFTSNKKI